MGEMPFGESACELTRGIRKLLVHYGRGDLAEMLLHASVQLCGRNHATGAQPNVALFSAPIEDCERLRSLTEEDLALVREALLELRYMRAPYQLIFRVDRGSPTLADVLNEGPAEMPGATTRPDHPKGVPELPAAPRADYDARGYLCHDKLFVTGRTLHRRSTLLIVNGNEITVEDSLFILLLRLVVELIKGEGGWVNRRALASEGIVGDPERFQPYSRLRRLLEGYLLDRDGRKFIENDSAKSYRISTHPDFVTYDRERLLEHPNHCVRELDRRLP